VHAAHSGCLQQETGQAIVVAIGVLVMAAGYLRMSREATPEG